MEFVNAINKAPFPPHPLPIPKQKVVMFMENCAQQIL